MVVHSLPYYEQHSDIGWKNSFLAKICFNQKPRWSWGIFTTTTTSFMRWQLLVWKRFSRGVGRVENIILYSKLEDRVGAICDNFCSCKDKIKHGSYYYLGGIWKHRLNEFRILFEFVIEADFCLNKVMEEQQIMSYWVISSDQIAWSRIIHLFFPWSILYNLLYLKHNKNVIFPRISRLIITIDKLFNLLIWLIFSLYLAYM